MTSTLMLLKIKQLREKLTRLTAERFNMEMSDDLAYTNGRMADHVREIQQVKAEIVGWYATNEFSFSADDVRFSFFSEDGAQSWIVSAVDTSRPGVMRKIQTCISPNQIDGLCDYFGGREVVINGHRMDSVAACDILMTENNELREKLRAKEIENE